MTTINDQSMADNKGRRIGTEPDNGGRNLFWRSHPSDRFLSYDRLPSLCRTASESVHHRGVYDAWANSVDADIGIGVIKRGAFRHADDTKF